METVFCVLSMEEIFVINGGQYCGDTINLEEGRLSLICSGCFERLSLSQRVSRG